MMQENGLDQDELRYGMWSHPSLRPSGWEIIKAMPPQEARETCLMFLRYEYCPADIKVTAAETLLALGADETVLSYLIELPNYEGMAAQRLVEGDYVLPSN
jgi:hypothetical protein